MLNDNLLKGLTDDQISKVRQCQNTGEILALAKQEGVELTDEQLSAVSGGQCEDRRNAAPTHCPVCQSGNIAVNYNQHMKPSEPGYECYCIDCQHRWNVLE